MTVHHVPILYCSDNEDDDGEDGDDDDGHLQGVAGQYYPSFGFDQLQCLRDRGVRILYPEYHSSVI